MCGIVGIWSRGGETDRLRLELANAVGSLHHRGPDDRGLWFNDSGVALGHTRLSIIDLSPAGHQPMQSADGRHVITFNGEIYNYRAIRRRLESAGHVFVSNSDTEVVLNAFREWGPTAVHEFIGMFALCLWDQSSQTLELYRDRVGVKPLYYGWHDSTLCFASELAAVRAFKHWRPEIDRHALGEFLQYGYIAGDRSIYRGVHKLPPGHRLVLTRDGPPVIERYWSVLRAVETPLQGSDQRIEEELEALLIDSARYRMVADVPVGIFLSGGIDSSIVTALLARHHGQSLNTYTIGFKESSHDESPWARKVAAHVGTRHTEYILEPPEAVGIARRWATLFDEPFGDPSGIPTLLISQLAGRDVKVVLSADGGDELFSGYNSYGGLLRRMATLRSLSPAVSRATAAVFSPISADTVDAVLAAARVSTSTRFAQVRRFRRARAMFLEPTPGRVFDIGRSCWQPEEVDSLVGSYESPRDLADVYPGSESQQVSLWDFHNYLPEDILTKVDRTTMAASIEGREPLLDHRLVEFAFRLPDHLRRGALGPKHILKKILYRYVPRELLERRKHGFSIPLDAWLRADLQDLVRDFLSERRIRDAGLLDWSLVRRLRADFDAGNAQLKVQLWYLLAFEMWRERWQ